MGIKTIKIGLIWFFFFHSTAIVKNQLFGQCRRWVTMTRIQDWSRTSAEYDEILYWFMLFIKHLLNLWHRNWVFIGKVCYPGSLFFFHYWSLNEKKKPVEVQYIIIDITIFMYQTHVNVSFFNFSTQLLSINRNGLALEAWQLDWQKEQITVDMEKR